MTDDKIYCVQIAPDAETIRRRMARGGIPANRFTRGPTMIDPTTSE